MWRTQRPAGLSALRRRAAGVGLLACAVGGATILVAAEPDRDRGVREVVDPRSGAQLRFQPRPVDAVDIDRLTTDTQRMANAPDRMRLVWWLPIEFWEASLAQDPALTPEGVRRMTRPLRGYTMIAVVDGKIGPLGGVTFEGGQAVRRGVRLKVGDIAFGKPLDEQQLDPDVRALLRFMKPLLSQVLGNLGQNLHFLVYENPGGGPVIDPTAFGRVEVTVGGERFEIDTPLPALLRAKHCPKCDRDFRGDYAACPYDRTGLVFAAP